MKFKFILLSLIILLITQTNIANATKLPDDVWKFVKKSIPNAQQRFDSVITVSADTMYIPLYPPTVTTVNEIAIEYTYPSKKTLKDYPEVVLLNNGYSLLKVMKDSSGNYTLTKKDDLPIKVRLGLMPQDMLTPIGLKMPESLKLTLGDLLIPSKEEASLSISDNEKEKINSPYNPTIKRNEFVPTVDFKEKEVFINPRNSKFIEVFDNSSKLPVQELKLSSMPSKIITSTQSKVALVLYWSGKNVEIIDLSDERVIAQIELDANASDVILNEKENIAYVSSANASSIYVIDLNKMQLTQVIRLDQKPSKLTYNDFDNSISFYDEFSTKIYNVTKSETDFIVQPIGSVNNLSKLFSDAANIYAISRTDNQLYVFDKNYAKLLSTIEIDKKPTDALMYNNKLYILCSKEGYLDVYDLIEQKIISKEQIAKDGFYSKITLMPNEKNILITGVSAKSYLLYNLETMKVVKKQDSYIDVANIMILDKAQKL